MYISTYVVDHPEKYSGSRWIENEFQPTYIHTELFIHTCPYVQTYIYNYIPVVSKSPSL